MTPHRRQTAALLNLASQIAIAGATVGLCFTLARAAAQVWGGQ